MILYLTLMLVLSLALLLLLISYKLCNHFAKTWIIFGIAAVFSIPGLLIVLYYTHLFDDCSFYYEFRSIPKIEISVCGLGMLAGVLIYWHKNLKTFKVILRLAIYFIFIIIFLPYLKPIIAPVNYEKIKNKWRDKQCMQTVGYTCGPASAATVLKYFDIDATEKEIAIESFTSRFGTENWYLTRALRRRGLAVIFHTLVSPEYMPLPCIAGVKIGSAGHFIAILPSSDRECIIADPLLGSNTCSLKDLSKIYQFTGFCMEVNRK